MKLFLKRFEILKRMFIFLLCLCTCMKQKIVTNYGVTGFKFILF